MAPPKPTSYDRKALRAYLQQHGTTTDTVSKGMTALDIPQALRKDCEAQVLFKTGRFEGPRLRGEILPGGGDWEIVRDHDGDQQTAHLNTRYNLVTHDGATIYLQTTGTRTGKKSVLSKLGNDTSITPDQFKMRLNLTMETGDPRYSWINQGVFVASSGRVGDQVIYDAYELL
ncbi:hypothetical protein LTR56_004686 [Elasticomyces elasticus]|nr:hypothetical protein LTR56_004686 [Elasticomyces elasticus]KAK3665540.1 hypothetical protein LTR22_003480 [Elasticomyces elasticus]KAK4930422.1 hypothetical protein LTR49_003163 [Elasticomyces elasticus]KAK5768852.1 hypothetical protein LTS12_000912 [Elasticomyces elasticus]